MRLKESLERRRQASSRATGREDVARGHRGAKEREGSLRGVEWGTWRERNDDGDGEGRTETAKRRSTRKGESAKRRTKMKKEGESGKERRASLEPPLLACRVLMNANHDPEAARSTCCFPVQIAYNFYCHGRNSSLMEARLISVLLLRPSIPCFVRFVALSSALASPSSLPPFTPASSVSPSSVSLRATSHPLPRLSASHSPLSAIPIPHLILDQRHRALCGSHIRRI